MTQAEIKGQPDVLLTDDELILVTEVCYDQRLEDVTTICGLFTPAKNKVARYLLEVYYDDMDDGVDRIAGGKKALYTDNMTNRLDVANRLRRLLMLPPFSAQQLTDIAALWRAQHGITDGPGRRSQSVETTAVW